MNKQVAIVGFAFRLPGAGGLELWDLLKAGADLVTEVPDDRWSKPYFLHPDKSEPGRSYTFAAGTLGDISGFDAAFFGISPREALQMDPQQRLLLELTWEAFESGGIRPSTVRGSQTAVYVGYSGSDYSYRRADDLSVIDASSMTGNTGSVAANRISYWFDLHGPSMSVDTACSSSLVALHQAWQAIQVGEVDQAIVAGISLHLHPMAFVGFSKASMLSPTGRCRVFDASGDGYVRSEGGGVFLLKDLALAEADGDRIFAVVAGAGSNCDGRTTSLTIPSRDAQADLLRSVYGRAGIAPDELDYLEAHGTGTAVGDPIEAGSIGAVLGQGRRPDNPLPVGSVKSNLGHLETASGVAGLVKALLCLEHRELPPSLHLETPNPNIPLDDWNLDVVTESRPLREQGVLTIGVNSFGFGGANGHVILRSYDGHAAPAPTATRGQFLPPLLLSAATQPALRELARRYADLLRASPGVDPYELAYNAFHHRELMSHRLLLPAEDPEQLQRLLDGYGRGEPASGVVEGEALAVSSAPVFVYSGNGSQWAGMGQVLLTHDAVFREQVDRVDRLLLELGGDSVVDDICQPPGSDRYALTEVAQPALFAIQVGITAVLLRHGIEPAATIGHSVGEVAAAWAAGALSLEQAVQVIHARSQAQGRTRGSGGMSAVALSEEGASRVLRELGLEDDLAIAGVNSPRGVTVAGRPSALKRMEDLLEEREVFHRRLPLDYAFHSSAMDPIRDAVFEQLDGLNPTDGGVFASTVTGDVLPGSRLTAEYWWRNIREPVRFRSAVEALIDRGSNLFVEIGPHPILRNYLIDVLRERDVEGRVVETLARADERPSRLDETVGQVMLAAPHAVWVRYFKRPAVFLDLPRYPWQRESFWHSPSPESHDDLHRRLEHPLLGFREPGDRLAWESRLDLRTQPELGDHRVGDSVLFPAAGFAEMALAGAAQRDPGDSHRVEDLEIHAPLLLETGATKRLRFVCDDRDGRFEITSNARLSDEPWTHHATGRLISAESRPPADRGLSVPERPFDFTAERHYELTRRVGLDYGPVFRVIEGVWRDGDRLTAKLRAPAPIETGGYRLSPAFLDGCFQMLIDHSSEDIERGATDAHVPIRIESLQTWREGAVPAYVDGALIRRSDRSALVDFWLYDADRVLIASALGVRFRRIKLVRDRENRHWLGYRLMQRPQLSARPVTNLPKLEALVGAAESAVGSPERSGDRTRYYGEVVPLLDVMCAAYAERAIREIATGLTTLSSDRLVDDKRLVSDQVPLFDHLVQLCVDEEALERTDGSVRWVADAGLPDPEMIWLRLLRDYPDHAGQVILAGRAGRQLPGILRGVVDGEAKVAGWLESVSVADYLRSAAASQRIDLMLGALIDRLLVSEDQDRLEPLRVLLCIDRSTAVATRLLRRFNEAVCDLTLFREAERCPDAVDEKLGALPEVGLVEVSFDVPPDQWALDDPAGYDLIVLDRLVSRLADPEAALRVLRGTLRAGGIVAVSEQQPSPWADFVFGVSPRWWDAAADLRSAPRSIPADVLNETLVAAGFEPQATLFDDRELQTGPCLSVARSPGTGRAAERRVPQPKTLLIVQDAVGFSASLGETLRTALQLRGSRTVPVLHGPRSVAEPTVYHIDVRQPDAVSSLLERLQGSGIVPDGVLWLAGLRPDEPLGPDSPAWVRHQAERCADIGRFFSSLSKANLRCDCWLVTSGAFVADTPANTDAALGNTSADALIWGFGRCLINECPELRIHLVDLAAPHLLTAMREGLVEEILNPGDDDELVLASDGRWVGRIDVRDPSRPTADDLMLAGDGEVVLDFDVPGLLNGLRWEMRTRRHPGPGEVAIEVKAAGLNFRDVMYAMGLLSDEAVEAGFAGATLGMELSGVVMEIGPDVVGLELGDPVIAFAPASFATRVVTDASAVLSKPSDWSFEAAATVPTTFFTVFYALRELARLQPGERLLIHGAAGGVGIAAIQLAQHLGAEIFATAGSPEKRDFVRQLGVDHVFDSRSLEFADEILECTGGEGVDIVLNSLAGEAINRNLRVLRPFGRFLELGKRDFYENTRIGLRPFRNNISYFGIDADQLMAERPELTSRLFRELFELFKVDVLKPLPFTSFPADDAVDAFRFMQQSKQIGKVVLTFDERPTPEVWSRDEVAALALDTEATYLVTGGTSGFGAATARWLVSKGARHLALLSRRGDAAPGVKELSEELAVSGASVRVFACDVADHDALVGVLEVVRASMPPLRGVVHAAMVIDDGLIGDLDAARIRKVFAPKVQGAVHLDAMTRELPLDFFVVFSSATTVFGNPGQASYVAANRFLEYLVEQRRAKGLPALAVSWGPIDDVGYLARNRGVGEALESRLGGRALSAEEALDSLERLLTEDRSGVAVLNFDWSHLRRALPAATSKRFIKLGPLGGSDDEFSEVDELRELLLAMPEQEVIDRLVDLVRQDIGQILRLDPERIDTHRSVHEFGMDSLMAMELAVSVEKRLGVQLPVMLLGEGPSITRLAERLVALLRAQPGQESASAVIEENVRSVAAIHGQTFDDQSQLAELVESLAASKAADHKA